MRFLWTAIPVLNSRVTFKRPASSNESDAWFRIQDVGLDLLEAHLSADPGACGVEEAAHILRAIRHQSVDFSQLVGITAT